MRVAAGGFMVCAVGLRLAAAGPAPGDVNLLVSAPTIVGVSSSATNQALRPENLVDGSLDTIWCSKASDLIGASIAVAVYAEVRISAIKLTVGDTRTDRSRGDLFTMNHRIAKVRVLRNSTSLFEQALDPDDRSLQLVTMDAVGGYLELQRGDHLKIEVVDVRPGTWPWWREVSVSELEVWGTLARGIAIESLPHAVVGEPYYPSNSGCQAPLRHVAGALPIKPRSIRFLVHALDSKITVYWSECVAEGSSDTWGFSWVSLVARGASSRAFAHLTFRMGREIHGRSGGRESTLAYVDVPLTTAETALLVHRVEHAWKPGRDTGTTISTLYRVTWTGFVPVMEYKSTWGERDGTLCRLTPPSLGPTMPRLEVACVRIHGPRRAPFCPGCAGSPGDARFSRPSFVESYRWSGAFYVKN